MQFSVIGADAESAAELWQWLNGTDGFSGRVRLVGRPESGPEADRQTMGSSVTDVVAVAVGAGGLMSVLAQALTLWLRRPRGVAVRLKVTRPDGAVTELFVDRATDTAAAEALVRSALGLDGPAD